VVARFQLIAAGLGAGAIDHRIAVGRLVPVYRGVYMVGHAPLTARGHWIAAVLACGPEALLSHRSAAALCGIAVTSSPLIDVTVPRSRHRQEGIAVHRSRVLDVEDRAVRHRIPVTSVPRTLLDLAEVVSAHRLERTLEEAERLDLIDMRALRRLVERSRGRHGLRPLAALLARSTPARHTRSELERRFLDPWSSSSTGTPSPSSLRARAGSSPKPGLGGRPLPGAADHLAAARL
jgi:predicted transcriptional regulator of viral defense system